MEPLQRAQRAKRNDLRSDQPVRQGPHQAKPRADQDLSSEPDGGKPGAAIGGHK